MKTHPEGKRAGLLSIRVAGKDEQNRFNQLLADLHPNDQPKRVGHELRLAIEQEGEWVGLMLWSSACQRLQDRDEWIGWNNAQRAQRLKLIVQLKRYLLLHEKGAQPNLASEALAAGTRALPRLWESAFGYLPLLAESFSDIEAHAGTCYRAAGWTPVGLSKGYAKHRADLFVHHGRPKKLWVRPLRKKAPQWLPALQLPKAYRRGETACAHGAMPVELPQMRSLAQVLRTVADPRAKNRVFLLGPILTVVAMALLSGARNIAQLQRFAWRLKGVHRAALGFRRRPGKKTCRMPSYSVFRDVLKALDLDAFARVLNEWLLARREELPRALALDGKMIRDTIGVLSVADVETGVPLAMRIMTQKEGDGAHCEKCVARAVVADLPDLQGALLSGDALHADAKMAQLSVENGADDLLQVKDNQPTLKAHLVRKTAHTPLLP